MVIWKVKNRGFTLVELLVVIAIIGFIMTIGGANYLSSLKKGRDAERISELKAIAAAQEQYFGINTEYATTSDTSELTSKYLPAGIPKDPRNSSPYVYDLLVAGDGSNYCFRAVLEEATGRENCESCSCDGTSCAVVSGQGSFCVQGQQ